MRIIMYNALLIFSKFKLTRIKVKYWCEIIK